MEANSLWKFNLSNYGRFRLSRYPKVTAPRLKKYTYESKALKVRSRIDFFLVAKNLTRYVKKSEIHPSIAPDHFAIYLLLSWTSETPRGPGLWKFNNTLLADADYVTKIHETYSRARAFYSDLEDKRLLWEMLKMEMRANTISFSKNKAKLTNTKESQIKARLEELDWLICNNFNSPDIDNVLKEYENLKMELQSIYDQKGKAAIFRSKCRWVENGKRPTKYFFNLEKKNHNKKP